MKRSIAIVAALLFPIVAHTQNNPAQPAPPNAIILSFKAFHAQYNNWIAAAFDSIPEVKYSYKPTPAQLSIGYIAQHLENANYQLCNLFGGTKYNMTAKDSLADTVKAKWPKDTLVARLKASITFCGQALDNVTDAQLTDQIPAGPPGSGRTVLRARYVTGYITDLADHWSQLAIYMRLNGMIPPSALPRKP